MTEHEGGRCKKATHSDKIATHCSTEFSFVKERKTPVELNTSLLTFLSVYLVAEHNPMVSSVVLQHQVYKGQKQGQIFLEGLRVSLLVPL